MIKLVSAMGLAALMLSPAVTSAMAAPAAKHHRAPASQMQIAPEYMADGSANSSPDNPVVIVAGKYIGRDPDANVRTDLIRESGSENEY